jgi:ornithine--oxo-acid transaminase
MIRPPAIDFIAREARFGAQNYEPLGVILSRGEGVFVWDTQGNRYLDCLSAYSAVNQGHCHPKILAAMIEQAGRLTLTSRAFHNDQLAPFYEQIAELTGSHKVLPMNTGAEAVESAIKSVRKWGYEVKGVPDGQAEIIVCADNFHGRTLGIIGFSTDPAARSFWAVRAGFQDHPLWRRQGAGGGDHPEHGCLPRRADPGRSRRHRSTAGLFHESAGALHRIRGDVNPRRNPDRARSYRQAACRAARRH